MMLGECRWLSAMIANWFYGNPRVVLHALVVGVCLNLSAVALGASFADFGIFGQNSVTAGSGIDGGLIGSNGAVSIGQNGEVLFVTGGGAFSIGSNAEILGGVVFQG